MRLKHIEIEASPDELQSSPTLRELLATLACRSRASTESDDDLEAAVAEGAVAADTAAEEVSGVAPEGRATVQTQLERNPAAQHFRRFLTEATSWPNAAVHGIKPKGSPAGTPLDYHRYLRIRRTGSQVGGFAYVWAVDGRVNPRLAFDSDDELHAIAPDAWRTHTGHRAYRVSIRIIDQSTLDQAIKLARTAYDQT